jgi:hypothetical protein
MDFAKKANSFLRDNKIISSIGGILGSAGVPFASQIGNVAGSLGYGRRRARLRASLRKGSGLVLPGAGRRRVNRGKLVMRRRY